MYVCVCLYVVFGTSTGGSVAVHAGKVAQDREKLESEVRRIRELNQQLQSQLAPTEAQPMSGNQMPSSIPYLHADSGAHFHN